MGKRGGGHLEARGGLRGDPPQNRGFKTEDLSGRVDLGGREKEVCFKSSCGAVGPVAHPACDNTYSSNSLCCDEKQRI